MAKVLFENAVILTAAVKDDQVLKNGEWESMGTKSLRLTVLVDSFDNDLSSGSVEKIKSVKEPKFDLDKVLSRLSRFQKVNIEAQMFNGSKGPDYRFAKITTDDGVCLTDDVSDEELPY